MDRPRDLSRLTAVNIGCGPLRHEDAIGVDRDPSSAADIYHDLDAYPWPFADDRFQEVRLHHVLEHLGDPDRAVREARRICAPGGIVSIVTPHFSSYESYGDITHKFHFGLVTFKPYYSGEPPPFGLRLRKLHFGSSPLCWPGRLIAALSYDLYEKYFCWIFPGRNMEFRLVAVKL
ncbi:MAG: methyltransferase domain-containing protein [Elusimicrobia bacterium]|nr:methyltransferase domain-containing protein [Elusimicrobiota bacterium]